VSAYGAFLRHVMLPTLRWWRRGNSSSNCSWGSVSSWPLHSGRRPARRPLSAQLLVATSGTTDWPGTYIALAAICLVVAVSQSGRTLGLDARLASVATPAAAVY